ncbi:Transcriptional regulator PadR-like family [Acididesulfobacillus acetoxydans]|uniref:Transcriptional regulator PadR-like family n=1 Tax=Acididesulfobacillus acetoxydans TaxID=1561005 RepID=A0A8S0WZI4_9FIRM|nr:PadR family transcriptional regulator [Acididesulfobacillus acetoxydans]CAA7601971.1 Transcriptional regulator PadR-like family [Acididesulfobacillus acetoxydans]CEJ08185.1 Transcriptional regulator PadR-like family [Acididesulfobacillus acetoxydans]
MSNVELILIKFIKAKPSYAYEVEKMIEEREMRQWVKIGGATVYQVLDRLCQKGLLEFKVEREGKMPERKRYHVTPEGERAFALATAELLRKNELYYFDLTTGLTCRHFMEPAVFRQAIEERLTRLNDFIDHFNERFDKARELYPTKRLLVREYLLSHYKLEQAFLAKLLKEPSA